MAEKRMFSKTIIDSDPFLEMPLSTQCLYFHLSMRADDDGFINSPRKIQKVIGASEDDLKLLIAKSFVIPFENGIIVIRHWKMNNYIQKDRYHETVYTDEKSQLSVDQHGAYSRLDTGCIQNGYNLDTQVRLGKVSIELGKDSINTISTAPIASATADCVISIPLNDKTEYGVTQNQIDEWQSLYPAVDVIQDLRNMRGWSLANSTRCKTRKGVLKFINSWLAKSQNSGGQARAQTSPQKSVLSDWQELHDKFLAEEQQNGS